MYMNLLDLNQLGDKLKKKLLRKIRGTASTVPFFAKYSEEQKLMV